MNTEISVQLTGQCKAGNRPMPHGKCRSHQIQILIMYFGNQSVLTTLAYYVCSMFINGYVCRCMYMHVAYMCVYTYKHIHTCIHTHTHIHRYIHTYICTRLHLRTWHCICPYTPIHYLYTLIHIYVYIYIHAYTHTHTHICIYIYIHICTHSSLPPSFD